MWMPLLMPLLLICMRAASSNYDHNINYWEAFAPGKLLQRLDALTDVNSLAAAVAAQPASPKAHRKADVQLSDEQEDAENLSTDVSDESGADYERKYEQFVRQYFDRLPEQHDDDVDGSVEEPSYEQEHDEPASHASNVKKSQQPTHCKRIKRNGQLCKICRQPRNNEVTETCSYSSEDQPEKYSYDSGSQYKRYRQEPEQQSSESEETADSKQAAPSSLCVRRQLKQRVCYDCKDSQGEQLHRCYDAGPREHRGTKLKKPRPQKRESHNAEQRIYKRTVSYAYDQASDQDKDSNNKTATTTSRSAPEHLPTAASGNVTNPEIRQHRRTVVKVLRSKRRLGADT